MASCVLGNGPQYELKKAPELFKKFAADYKRHYEDVYDIVTHYEAFRTNLKIINKLNSMSKTPSSATFDINEFADIAPVEFAKRHLGFNNTLSCK